MQDTIDRYKPIGRGESSFSPLDKWEKSGNVRFMMSEEAPSPVSSSQSFRSKRQPAIIFFDANNTLFYENGTSCPGVEELLTYLRHNHPHIILCVLSASEKDSFEKRASRIVHNSFCYKINGETHLMGAFKLNPSGKSEGIAKILKFLKEQGLVQGAVDPARTIMFGDTPSDMLLGSEYRDVHKFAVGTSYVSDFFQGSCACTHYFDNLSNTKGVLKALDKAIGLNFEKRLLAPQIQQALGATGGRYNRDERQR